MPFDRRKRLPLALEPTPGRVCWLCRHIVFDSGSPGYSDQTPGWGFSMSCTKGYWEFDNTDTLDDFREQLEAAVRCADFVGR
jgi:hypothetical protein